jgi:hypothetical protein
MSVSFSMRRLAGRDAVVSGAAVPVGRAASSAVGR